MTNVYVKTDEAGRILAANSGVFLSDPAGWVQIDEGDGDRYVHAQGNYFALPLVGDNGCHNYVLDGSTARESTAEEQAAELAAIPAPEPSQEALLQAQVDALQAQVDALLGVE
ncbi:MAG: hypothetical protein PHE47_03445 [Oscillospiraceae bacterium]|nr:hypothetical protein [Oscillospiraceae bacterium]